jgi:prepilin-type N-terminal cleavage/methylation domain-containing protein
MAGRTARSQGFTLLELVVATCVLTIGAVVVYPTFFTFRDLSRGAYETSLATYDLDAAVEYVRGMPFQTLVTFFPPAPPVAGDQPRPEHRASPSRWVWPARLSAFDGVHFGRFSGPRAAQQRMAIEIEYPWRGMGPGVSPPENGPYAGYFHPTLQGVEPPDPLVFNVHIRWTDHSGRPREKLVTTALTR